MADIEASIRNSSGGTISPSLSSANTICIGDSVRIYVNLSTEFVSLCEVGASYGEAVNMLWSDEKYISYSNSYIVDPDTNVTIDLESTGTGTRIFDTAGTFILNQVDWSFSSSSSIEPTLPMSGRFTNSLVINVVDCNNNPETPPTNNDQNNTDVTPPDLNFEDNASDINSGQFPDVFPLNFTPIIISFPITPIILPPEAVIPPPELVDNLIPEVECKCCSDLNF